MSAVVAVMTLVAVGAYRPYQGPWESAPKWFYFGVGVALTVSCFGVVLGAIWLRGQASAGRHDSRGTKVRLSG